MSIRYPQDKQHLPFGNSAAIQDSATLKVLTTIDVSSALTTDSNFCTTYLEWIKSDKLNTITGLEEFSYSSYSNGTTEAFDKFYLKNATKRFRCFKGEYIYHRLSWRDKFNWEYLEDDILQTGDAVVISLPFSDTGNEHILLKQTLEQCDLLGIPVLIDCAYFGICSDINFNFSYSCITDITFSLSKIFPVAHARIGMRLTKVDDDDSLFVCNKAKYVNKIGEAIGLKYITEFSPSYIVNKYKSVQTQLCAELNVVPSNTVLFGIDMKNEWPQYNRGTATNRLGLHKFLHIGSLDVKG